MKLAWPILPILIIMASVALAGFALVQLITPVDVEVTLGAKSVSSAQTEALPQDVEEAEAPDAILPVPAAHNAHMQAATAILMRSPFQPDRSAFSRTPPPAPPPPPPELEPEFVGFLGRGENLRAMIIWEPGQEARIHRIGDDTPWGTLAAFDENGLKFEGEKGMKVLALY